MKNISINEWLDDEKVSALLTDEKIKKLKSEYRYFYKNGKYYPDEFANIEIMTGFPLAEEYFQNITTFNNSFLDNVKSEKDYIYRYAECVLKCHILCAAQIVFKFPLWQDPELPEWEEMIKNVLKDLDALSPQYDDQFAFPCFFPYYSNEFVSYPRFMLRWIYDVIDEFFEIAEENMYQLSEEDREKEIAERRAEIKKLEDLLKK